MKCSDLMMVFAMYVQWLYANWSKQL